MTARRRGSTRPARGDADQLLARVRAAVGRPAPDPSEWHCPACGRTGAIEDSRGRLVCGSEWCSLGLKLEEAEPFAEEGCQ